MSIKGYKYRAYPNKSQVELLNKFFGCSRFVYNYYLNWRTEQWQKFKQSTNYTLTANHLSQVLKNELPWLDDADSTSLQQSLKDLDSAFQNFFHKRSGYPKFKKKFSKQSYRAMCVNDNIRIEGNRIKLPKIGWVKIANSRDFNGVIKHAIVTKTASGKYFISLCVEEATIIKPNAGGVVGIDVGIKDFYTDSNGCKVDNPKTLYKHERKLKRLQRKLSRKEKGSSNRNKARIKLAREYEKVSNIRKEFLHKQAFALANENQVVCAESLNIKGMLKNHHLAKAISDVSWSEFFRILDYKLAEYGGELVKVPTFYPSSQTCSCCGFKNPLVKNLNVRNWTCPECGSEHDRDINAANNILDIGLSILNQTTVGDTGSNACGDVNKTSEATVKAHTSLKQESPTSRHFA